MAFSLKTSGSSVKDKGRSVSERFAVPYVFRPRLTLIEAMVAAGFAFLRIVLGSLLFAFCGTGIWMTWNAIHNVFWRLAAVLPQIFVFFLLLALLMIAISALARPFFLRRSR